MSPNEPNPSAPERHVRLERPVAPASFALSALVCGAIAFALAHASLWQAARVGEGALPEPLAGFALAAFVLWSPPYALAIGAGMFGAWAAGGARDVPSSIAAALLLVGGAWIARACLSLARGFEPRLERVRDAVALLLAIAGGSAAYALGSCAVAGSLDVRAALARALASGVGCALVVPLACAWRTRALRDEKLARAVDLVVGVCAVSVLGAFAFGDVAPVGWTLLASWCAFPAVVWSALRCGPRGSSLVTFVFACIAVLQTLRGSGPFSTPGHALELSAFLGVLASTGLLVGAFHGQRSRNERRERAERARLELALSGSSGGLWEWELATGKVDYSTRFRELLGFAPEVEAPSLHALVHPDDHAMFDAAVDEHLEHGAPYEVDVRLRRASGESRWFHVRGVAQRDERGAPVRLLGSIADVHAARVAEQELHRHVHELEAARDAHERQSHEISLLVVELAAAHARLEDAQRAGAAAAAVPSRAPADFDRTLDELVKLLATSSTGAAEDAGRRA